MQTIAGSELKRRGLAALDGLLDQGPVQVLQRNRPACVVLSPAEYERLSEQARGGAPGGPVDVWDLLLADPDPPGGGQERSALDAGLAAERAAWERP
jgi:hypothetical protein